MPVVTPVDKNNAILFSSENPAYVQQSGAQQITPIPAGTNHIGSVSVDTSLPSGSNVIGTVKISQEKFVEQKSQIDAVSGDVTFANPVSILEIVNTDSTNDGTFTVNGLAVIVPKSSSFKAAFGGTPSPDVTITGSTVYLLNRFE